MHFFIEPDKLTTQLLEDAYGPDSDDATTKYNVTSRFQLTQEAKAFACQSGLMMVQNSTQDDSLVNVVIEPDGLIDKVPLNVKYYVYRGILKSSLIIEDQNAGTCDIIGPDASNNDLIKKMHNLVGFDDYTCKQVGYDRSLSNTLPIRDILDYSITQVSPVPAKEGEWMGTFSKDHKIGFEIILKNDNNDFDLGYLRATSHTIDVTGLSGSELKLKREKILDFIDPCAFFGAQLYAKVDYYDSSSNSTKTTTVSPSGSSNDPFLFTKLLDKFDTKNKVYLDIRSERGYSYNLYGNYNVTAVEIGNTPEYEEFDNIQLRTASGAGDGTIGNDGFNAQEYQTSNWPILILESSHASGNTNTFQLKLRIDDNQAPVLYLDNYEVLKNKYILEEDRIQISINPPRYITNYNFIKVKTLIDVEDSEDDLTDWTNTIKLRFPNTQTGTSRSYIGHYLKIHYFRSKHNDLDPGNGGSPDSVLKNVHYWDSAFCSIDIPELDVNTNLGFVEGAEPIYLREPNHNDGTGNFQLTMKHGAYWDNSRILMYATIHKENPLETSEKQYLNTFSQELNFSPPRFCSSDLKRRLEIICRPYEISTTETIKIPGINLYRRADIGDNSKNYKENAMFLGLSKEEFQAIQNDTQLAKEHSRYIFLERQTLGYFETEPDNNNGGARYRYYKYKVKIQGFDSNYDLKTEEPSNNGSPIIVYSRDNQFFSSTLYSNVETLTTGKNGENQLNRIEFHVYNDGIVKINDNIDFALLDLTSARVYYKYHDENADEFEIQGLSEGGITADGLELVMANKMARSRDTKSGVINAVPAGFTQFINYQDENVEDVDASRSHENNEGDIVTEGNFDIRKYYNRNKKRFLVRLVTNSTNDGTNVTNYFRNIETGFDLEFEETLRLYASPAVAAAVLGALIRIEHNIVSQGFAYKKGSSYPSSEHVNGEAFDSNYSTDAENFPGLTLEEQYTRDRNFIRALNSFGFNLHRIGHLSYHVNFLDSEDNTDIDNISPYLHDGHLHSTNVILIDDYKEL